MTILGIHFHKWAKWERVTLVQSSPILDIMSGRSTEEQVQGQKRTCEECGIEVLRAIGY
jgi:hypothetical protein